MVNKNEMRASADDFVGDAADTALRADHLSAQLEQFACSVLDWGHSVRDKYIVTTIRSGLYLTDSGTLTPNHTDAALFERYTDASAAVSQYGADGAYAAQAMGVAESLASDARGHAKRMASVANDLRTYCALFNFSRSALWGANQSTSEGGKP